MNFLLPGVSDLEGTPRGNFLPSLAFHLMHSLGVVWIAKGKPYFSYSLWQRSDRQESITALCEHHRATMQGSHLIYLLHSPNKKRPLVCLKLNLANIINWNTKMKPSFILLSEVSKGACWREFSLPLMDSTGAPWWGHIFTCWLSKPPWVSFLHLSLWFGKFAQLTKSSVSSPTTSLILRGSWITKAG